MSLHGSLWAERSLRSIEKSERARNRILPQTLVCLKPLRRGLNRPSTSIARREADPG